MTPKLPIVSDKQAIKALERAGFFVDRQSGSHVILKRFKDNRRVVVPFHAGDLHVGIVKEILRQSGLPPEELS
ncbi:addiction module toxin, HicA family [Patescibacteria group bacterium]|nr:MAG: addiction module toxin, HicA family [Patescibacteria group bacterium]